MSVVHPFMEAVIHLGWKGGRYQRVRLAEIIAKIDCKSRDLSRWNPETVSEFAENLPQSIPVGGFCAEGEDHFVEIESDITTDDIINKEIITLRGMHGCSRYRGCFGFSGSFLHRKGIYLRGDEVTLIGEKIPQAIITRLQAKIDEYGRDAEGNPIAEGCIPLERILRMEGINHIIGSLPVMKMEQRPNQVKLTLSRSWQPWSKMRARLIEDFAICEEDIEMHRDKLENKTGTG